MSHIREIYDEDGVEEEYCDDCGMPVDECECSFDEDEESPEAA
jgi:hypothetical protein